MRHSSQGTDDLVRFVRRSIGTKDFHEAKRVHDRVIASDLAADRYVSNLVIELYGKCGRVDESLRVFDRLVRKNIKSWNALLHGFSLNVCVSRGWRTFVSMPERDFFSWNVMITVLLQAGNLRDGRHLFERMPRPNAVSYNLMIKAYTQLGRIDDAKELFDRASCLNAISWTTLIAANAESGKLEQARDLFERMPLQDKVSSSVMIQSLGLATSVDKCWRIFVSMQERDVVSWTCLLVAYAENKHLAGAKWSFERMPMRGTVTWTAMASAYSQAGNLLESRRMFSLLPELDTAAWNAMIAAYAHCGNKREEAMRCLDLARAMKLEGFSPNHVTYAAILSACGHAGLVSDVWENFVSMVSDHGIVPIRQHFSSIVDALGRAGRMDEARELIQTMPFEADETVWTAMLNACQVQGDVSAGVDAAKRVVNEKDGNPFVVAASLYRSKLP